MKPRKLLIALVALAFFVRLMFALVLPRIDPFQGDSGEYVRLADNLRHLGVFSASSTSPWRPTVFRPPLYPALIAALWGGAHFPYYLVLLTQCVLGTVTVWCVYLIADGTFSSRVAGISAIAMAVAPMTCRYASLVMTETLFTALVTIAMLCWFRNKPILAGALLGLAALARSVLLPFIVLLPCFAFLPVFRKNWRQHTYITLTALAVISPWSVRNAIDFHRLIPIATAGWGSNLLQGTIQISNFGGNPWSEIMKHPARRITTTRDPSESERILLHRGILRIVAAPGQWMIVRILQYPRLFADHGEYLYPRSSYGAHAIKVVFLAGNALLLVLAFIGLAKHWQKLGNLRHLVLFPFFVMVSQVPMWTEARYSIPITPSLIIIAAALTERSEARLSSKRLNEASADCRLVSANV